MKTMTTPSKSDWALLTFAVLALLVLSTVGYKHRPRAKPSVPLVAEPASELPPGYFAAKPATPLLYRLSVLPGGARTVGELKMKIQTDPVLVARFQGCDLNELHEVTIMEDIPVFITFRRGNVIKWNSKPVVIKKGERAVVGCGRTVLMRCGNEINWAPQTPSEELPPGTLETPVTENTAPPETIAPPPVTAESTSTTTSGSTPPVIVGGGFPGGPGGGGFGPPPTPPIHTPEPGTWLMIIVGGVLALAVYACGDLRSHFPWR